MRLVVTALALAVLAILVYRMWEPFIGTKPKKEIPVNTANLYFFYTDWCGFSQKALPEWEKLESSGKNKFGNTVVNFVKVDAEADRDKAEEYEVDAYPTIKLETPDGIYDFKKTPTYESLLAFLLSSLGKEATDSK